MSALLALRGRGEELQAAHGARPAVQRADVVRPASVPRVTCPAVAARFLRIPILTSDSYYITPYGMVSK